ncbi:hypothetical protein ACNF49_42275 [Actinomadura sp. ATCC 39365]|uniref:hypothetical protein n=1 Tax=Nonomuraea sp. NPDC005692 TaxID=3157168 RepID=UPI0033EFBCF4
MTIEQETGRVAPVRRAMPKPGTRRPGVSHQTKPRPRPDTDGRRPADARPGESAAPARRPAARRPSTKRQRAPFVLLVVGLMCGGLVSLLLLNIMLNRDAITDAKLRDEIAVARQEKEALQQKLDSKMQPQNLADRAEAQGDHLDKSLRPYNAGDPTAQAVPER